MFCTFLAIDFLALDNTEIEKYAYEVKASTNSVKRSNYRGWQSSILTMPNDQITLLADAIEKRLNNIKNELGYIKNSKILLNHLWLNINHTGSFNRPHHHPDCDFSGVYYVKTPAECGQIVLQHPSSVQAYVLRDELIEDFTDYTSSTCTVAAETGKLLMFPSWVEHYVEPNCSDEDRISIAFNASIHLEENNNDK